MLIRALAALALLGLGPVSVRAADPLADVCEKVNSKLVKVFGAGGFSRLNNFGTGILISPDGHVLTVASQLLDTPDLVVHLYDGRRMKAEVLAVEPDLDAAVLRIKVEGKKNGEPTGLDLPYFDFAQAAARPPAKPADWVLAFTNQFEIALRDEPLTAQRGVLSAITRLSGRQGVFDFPYTGDVYVVDAVSNNPGSAGGALTDRAGNLLGVVGRELKNAQTNTYINYAVPVWAKVQVTVRVKENGKDEDKTLTLSLPEFVAKGMKGEYKAVKGERPPAGEGGWTGIVFVPNVLARTPAYVEDVVPDSPAAKAGLRPDDLVSFVDGEPVGSIAAFHEFLRTRTRPGGTIRLEVRRGEGLQSVELTLGSPPPKPAAAPPPAKK
ncbi:MAG: S1C family serine protease [Gemmataceae bacterium]|nr:S1C family serine protease [Gemmataceae bacterium]